MKKNKISGISFLAGNWPLEKDKITLIFIHGSGLSKSLWINQVDKLSDHVNTLAVDLPGHGESDGEASNQVREYSKVIENIIKKLDVERVVLCGLSMGGAVVLNLLLTPFMDYSGAILLNTGARLKVLPVILDTIINDYNKFIEISKTSLFSENVDGEKIKFLLEDMSSCKPESTYADFELCDNFDVMDRLGEINIPVLVVTSGEDRLTPQKYGIFLGEHINNSTRVHIEDAGHMAPIEKSDDVNEAILSFLKNNKF